MKLAESARQPVRAVQGTSPQDVAAIVDAELDVARSVDFAFIDGLHTSGQVVLDYKAVRDKAAPEAAYLFRDVTLFDMHAGMAEIGRLAGSVPQLLLGTPSGMAILFDPARHTGLGCAVSAFAPPESALRVVRQAAWDRRHRHPAGWRRSYHKRLNRPRGLVETTPQG